MKFSLLPLLLATISAQAQPAEVDASTIHMDSFMACQESKTHGQTMSQQIRKNHRPIQKSEATWTYAAKGTVTTSKGVVKGKVLNFLPDMKAGGIVAAAIGMGAYGLRPVVEIQFADYFYPASDQIVSEAARLRYRSAGDFTCPMTIRMPCGGGIFANVPHDCNA